MDRRVALVAVWALFAAAAVGVGFGAAGLVGDPFTDGIDDTAATAGLGPTTEPAPTPTPTSSEPTASPTGSSKPPRTATATAAPSHTTAGPATSRPTRSATAEVTVSRTLSTRAGVVSARCRGDLVRLGASPAVGWELTALEPSGREAKVRFERVGDGEEDRVEVRATCVGGRPRFAVEDDRDSDDDHTEEPGSGDDTSDDSSD